MTGILRNKPTEKPQNKTEIYGNEYTHTHSIKISF